MNPIVGVFCQKFTLLVNLNQIFCPIVGSINVVNEQLATLINDAKRTMVCTANDLLEWKDFPKGLRVLLLDEDTNSAAEIKSKLEEMEYIVTSYFSELEALSTIENKKETFHIAIVEINAQNSDGRYSFLEIAKDVPTIMTSKENCMSAMMKCIALGAVEFLVKPLSEDKLRNIWQHVVHKAFNANGSANSESVKEFVGTVLESQQLSKASQGQLSEEPLNDIKMEQNDSDQSTVVDKFPAPSTPQLRQGGRSTDDGDYHDQIINSPTNESREVDGETISVDITFDHSVTHMEVDVVDAPQPTPKVSIKEEDDSSESSKGSDDSSSKRHEKDDSAVPDDNSGSSKKDSNPQSVRASKSSRKKMKVDWTPELHKKFVQAVEQLGVDQAIPSRILELMKVNGLTRHNVASHLQKYRMNRRHILPKEDERRWPQPRVDSSQRSYFTHRPVMAYPPYQTNPSFAPGQVYPVWGQHGFRPPGVPMWNPTPYPWQHIESWHWKPYPGMHADAWGCPVMPTPPSYPSNYTQVPGTYRFQSPDTYAKHSADANPVEEVIDEVVKEAINNPWLPLPIGLKPPSTDTVLAELSRQGISTIPPTTDGHH